MFKLFYKIYEYKRKNNYSWKDIEKFFADGCDDCGAEDFHA